MLKKCSSYSKQLGEEVCFLAFQFRSDNIPISLLKLQQNLDKVNAILVFAFPLEAKIKQEKY